MRKSLLVVLVGVLALVLPRSPGAEAQSSAVPYTPTVPTQMNCNAAVEHATHSGSIRSSSVIIVRCYGANLAGVTVGSGGDVSSHFGVCFQQGGLVECLTASDWLVAQVTDPTTLADGQIEFVGVVSSSYPDAWTPSTGYLRVFVTGATTYNAYEGRSDRAGDYSLWQLPGPVWEGIPSWPAYYPTGATPVADAQFGGERPKASCQQRSRVFNSSGDVRANFYGYTTDVTASGADGEDRHYWQFEWDAATAPPFSSAVDWDTAEVYEGQAVSNVEVPTADVPDGGWLARYVVIREYETAVYEPIPLLLDPDAYAFDWEDDYHTYSPFTGWGGFLDRAARSYLKVDSAPTGDLGSQDPDIQPIIVGWDEGDLEEIAWFSVAEVCTLRLDPDYAGTPDGDTSSDGPDGGTITDPPTENPDGSPGCAPPGGWSWNPLTWIQSATCALSEFLPSLVDALWDLVEWLVDQLLAGLGLVVDAIEGVLDGLAALVIPDEPIGDRLTRIADEFEGSTGDVGTALGDTVSGTVDAIDAANTGACEGPTLTIPWPGDTDVEASPFDACSGPAHQVRNVLYPASVAVIAVGGVRSLWNRFARFTGAQELEE